MLVFILFTFIIYVQTAFNFKGLTVYPDNYVIGESAMYTIQYNRNIQYISPTSYGLSPYDTQQVPSDGTITVVFPSQYTTLTNPIDCTSVQVTLASFSVVQVSSNSACTLTGQTITVTGAFSNLPSRYVSTVILKIQNIINPIPAITTGQFDGTLGDDTAIAAGSSSVTLSPAQFDSCTITFQNPIVNQTSSMIITLDPKHTLTSSAYIQIQVPGSRRWLNDISPSYSFPLQNDMDCVSTSPGVQPVPDCSGNWNLKTMYASDLLLSDTSNEFSFSFSDFKSPPTISPTDQFIITSFDGNDAVDECTVTVTELQANQITVSVSASGFYVNSAAGLTFSFNPVDFMNENDDIRITFPSSLGIEFSFIFGSNNFGTSTVNGQVITCPHRRSPSKTNLPGIPYFFTITNIRAPVSTKVTDQIKVEVIRNGLTKMEGFTTIQALPKVLTVTLDVSIHTVWASTQYKFTIQIADSLSSTGMVKIYFPTEINPTLLTSCAQLSGTGLVSVPVCSYQSNDRVVTISSMSSSAITSPKTVVITVLSVVNAPSTAPLTDQIQVQTYYTDQTDTLVAAGTVNAIDATIGTIDITSVTVTPSSYIALATTTSYTIQFTNTYQIPQGGSIEITIPNDISMDVAAANNDNCEATVNSVFSSTQCTASQQTTFSKVVFTTIASTGAIAAGSTIQLTIKSSFTNPIDTRVVSSFTIHTYHSDTYSIESLDTGISVKMQSPAPMTSASVTRSNHINSDSSAIYTIKLRQQAPLTVGDILYVTFPSDIEVTNGVSCTNLLGTTLTCVPSSNQLKVTLNSAYSPTAEFGVIVSGVINPPSFAPLNQDFYFLTESSSGLVEYGQLFFTSTLLNNVASTFQTRDFVFSPQIYGQATSLQLTILPSARITPSYLMVTLASSFSVTTLACTSWTCIPQTATHQIKVQGATASEMSITITGFSAPLSAPTQFTKVTSFTAAGYKIDQVSDQIIFQAFCDLPCRTCDPSNQSLCLSCYSNTDISDDTLLHSSGNSCYEICPDSTYLNSQGTRCLDCSSLCLTCTTSANNCTDCKNTSQYPYLYYDGSDGECRTECPLGTFPDLDAYPVQCIPCYGLCETCTDDVTCLSCIDGFYFYEGQCINPCPDQITITNDVTNECDECSSACAECEGNVNNCTQCSNTAIINIQDDGTQTCVDECPSPKVNKDGFCDQCSTECKTCSITFDNCTSCESSSAFPFYYDFSCLDYCPEYYYEHLADAECKLCSSITPTINCDNCTSTSTCGTCNLGFVFHQDRCFDTTPPGYFNESGYAEPCSVVADCATCEGLAINCTSCITLSLDGNDCVPDCPSGTVDVNGFCTQCDPPCRTCSESPRNCTACIIDNANQLYLSNFDCIPNCPLYTYENDTNNECTPCVSPCQDCISATKCVTCRSGFFLLDQSCINPCDFGYLGVNRICQPCTNNCESCQLQVDNCLTCLDGYYYVASTKDCVDNCTPTGLYPNQLTMQCTTCTPPCDTCSLQSSNCTSCLTGFLYDLDFDCVDECPDGYYGFNKQCIECKDECATCTSFAVCVTCQLPNRFYLSNCLPSCPDSHPVIINNQCTPCTDPNCLDCDEDDQCLQCDYPWVLFAGDCRSQCPENYQQNITDNGAVCQYVPPNDVTTDPVQQTLEQSLESDNLFPVPFTIGACFIGIACLMSKFQHSTTFIVGALYSLWSVVEWAAVGLSVYFYLTKNKDISVSRDYVEAFIFVGAIVVSYLLNIVAIFVQNCFLRGDQMFRRWTDKQSPNKCTYFFCSIMGLFITHKFKNIMFCKLFGFDTFKAKLDNVQNFKIFNIFSFLSFIPSAGILLGIGIIIYKHRKIDQAMMIYIDVAILTIACIILAILTSKKSKDFFEEKDQDGYVMHKRIADCDSIIQDAIIPMIAEDEEMGGNMKNRFQTGRGFKSFDTMSEESDDSTIPKVMMNISIQAAPVLQDYSKIDFCNDDEMSDFSMFKKADKSVNMTQQLQHDVSIQNEPMNIFDQRQVSIQNNPFHEDASVQNIIDARDVSLQNAVVQQEQGQQMSYRQEDRSIQYSAKPHFQNISQEMYESQNQSLEQVDQIDQQRRSQVPAERDGGLQKQLQLDVNDKIRQKAEEQQQRVQMQREREKEEMIKKFHREQEKKIQSQLQRQKPMKRVDEFDNMNRIYNNQSSVADSSIMSSNANMVVNFQNRRNSRSSDQQQAKNNDKPERLQSAKTQKQLIEMLSKKEEERQLNIDSSMSFNVTRDLDTENQNKNRYIVYEENDKEMKSDGEDNYLDEEQDRTNEKKLAYVLPQQQNLQEIPSMEKSRSTNFLSTVRGRPPRQVKKNMDERNLDSSNTDDLEQSGPIGDEQQINMRPFLGGNHKKRVNYQEEDIQFQPRTNLTHLPPRRNRDTISAQQLGNRRKAVDLNSDELSPDKRQLRHNPLPLPKMERLPSQQSHGFDDSRQFSRSNSRRGGLPINKRLQFDEDERLDSDEISQRPRGLKPDNKLTKVSSQGKFRQNSGDRFDKPVHRQLLGKQSIYNRTDKYLEKQQKRVQEARRKIDQINVMLERPGISNSREKKKSYLQGTASSKSRDKNLIQKVYKNNPFEKR